MAASPFDGRLPPGWTARLAYDWHPGVWSIRDETGSEVRQHWPDPTFPHEATLRSIWWDYLLPGAGPRLRVRYGREFPEWDSLREAVELLDRLGSLGG